MIAFRASGYGVTWSGDVESEAAAAYAVCRLAEQLPISASARVANPLLQPENQLRVD